MGTGPCGNASGALVRHVVRCQSETHVRDLAMPRKMLPDVLEDDGELARTLLFEMARTTLEVQLRILSLSAAC